MGADGSSVAVFWLHGSPNVGSPPEPLFVAAEANGLYWVSYDRPGYGGSDPHPGRDIASAAADVAAAAADESDAADLRLGYGETAVPYLEPTATLPAPTISRPCMKSSAISLAQPLRMS